MIVDEEREEEMKKIKTYGSVNFQYNALIRIALYAMETGKR